MSDIDGAPTLPQHPGYGGTRANSLPELEALHGRIAVLSERVDGETRSANDRWNGHSAVHSRDGEALDKALVRTEAAIAAASDAHRREHLIEKQAKDAADAAHQEQHKALNELRNVVGDLTGQYVRNDTLTAAVTNWERRFTEITAQEQAYRDAMAKEQSAYRDSVAKQEQAYRDQQSAEIRSLRESRSVGEGHRLGASELLAYLIGAAGIIGVIVTVASHWK